MVFAYRNPLIHVRASHATYVKKPNDFNAVKFFHVKKPNDFNTSLGWRSLFSHDKSQNRAKITHGVLLAFQRFFNNFNHITLWHGSCNSIDQPKRVKKILRRFKMTKGERNALAAVSELLTMASMTTLQSKSEFSKGMAAAYKEAAQKLVWKMLRNEFSE